MALSDIDVSEMDARTRLVVLVLIVLLPLALSGLEMLYEEYYGSSTADTAADADASYGVVDEVVDGDTVVLQNGESVRLLGINTPEDDEPYADAATTQLEELVQGENVTLEQGRENRDRYDRLLRHIHYNGTHVNRALVAQGVATVYYPSGQDRYLDDLLDAEESARVEERILWDRSPAADCVDVTDFRWDAPGDDSQNRNEEYVTFHNRCGTINMDEWTVWDAGTNRYMFPETVLETGETVTLYSGDGANTDRARYWDGRSAVWRNTGDRLFLRDESGELVEYEAYGQYAG